MASHTSTCENRTLLTFAQIESEELGPVFWKARRVGAAIGQRVERKVLGAVPPMLGAYLDDHDAARLIDYADLLGNRTVFKRLGYLVDRSVATSRS